VERSDQIRVAVGGGGGIEVVATAGTGSNQVDVITREMIKMVLVDAVDRIQAALRERRGA
jgi:hypothetical protein